MRAVWILRRLARGSLPVVLAAGGLVPLAASAQTWAQSKTMMGYDALQAELGAALPTGVGVSVTIGEALYGGYYRLNPAWGSPPVFPGKAFVFPSGNPTNVSSHANFVGYYFFSTYSMAPNIGRAVDGQNIANYEASHWLGDGYLHVQSGALPDVEARDGVNQSWIGTFGNEVADVDALRRLDYAIARDDFVLTAGLNNGSSTTVPSLLSSSYNGLIVGLSNGAHSRGTTTVDGAGRGKPDIVAPLSATSWAAPTVGSAAALLIETARSQPGLANGEHSVVVKSTLLAGASREGSSVPFTWSHTSAQPLDRVYGAGQLNVYNSYHIAVGGEYDASESADAGRVGWDYGVGSDTAEQRYFFDVGGAGGMFSAALAWNREVTPALTGDTYEFSYALANLDLRLYSAAGYSLGAPLLVSTGLVDNVELLYASQLNPGRYALGVSSNTASVVYGLSWQAIPEPATLAIAVWGIFGLAFRRRFRTPRWRRAGRG